MNYYMIHFEGKANKLRTLLTIKYWESSSKEKAICRKESPIDLPVFYSSFATVPMLTVLSGLNLMFIDAPG